MNEQQKSDYETIKLAAYFFKRLVSEQNMPPELAVQVLPSYFLGWTIDRIARGDLDVGEICREVGAGEDTWERFRCLLESPAGVEQIWKVWPHIVLDGRPTPTHPLHSMQLNALFRWQDGHVLSIAMPFTKDMVAGEAINDAMVAGLMRNQLESIVRLVGESSLDGLYAQAEQMGGDYPYEVMMGVLLKMKPQIVPAVRPFYELYVRLVQRLLRMPVPPGFVQGIAQTAKAALQQVDGKNEPARGGWVIG